MDHDETKVDPELTRISIEYIKSTEETHKELCKALDDLAKALGITPTKTSKPNNEEQPIDDTSD